MEDLIMPDAFEHVPDLLACFETQPQSIVSRTLHDDRHCKVVLFGFAAGQALSEHTAAVPAIVQILSGEAQVKLGDEAFDAGPQAWFHLAPHLAHSITARTDVAMLLTLLKSPASAG